MQSKNYSAQGTPQEDAGGVAARKSNYDAEIRLRRGQMQQTFSVGMMFFGAEAVLLWCKGMATETWICLMCGALLMLRSASAAKAMRSLAARALEGQGNPYAVARPWRWKWVLRWSPDERKFRVGRLVWDRIKYGQPIGKPDFGRLLCGHSYSAKFTVGLLWFWEEWLVGVSWNRESDYHETFVWINLLCLSLQFHLDKSYGGLHE